MKLDKRTAKRVRQALERRKVRGIALDRRTVKVLQEQALAEKRANTLKELES